MDLLVLHPLTAYGVTHQNTSAPASEGPSSLGLRGSSSNPLWFEDELLHVTVSEFFNDGIQVDLPHGPVSEFFDEEIVQRFSQFPRHSPEDQSPELLCGFLRAVNKLPELLCELQSFVNQFLELHRGFQSPGLHRGFQVSNLTP
ncbi:hypothetical protein CRENBAI_005890 [Crenichthys baileyi]|uniref:Uncharacterized protein n=1 Tax=Crenichthys baileyi TaxID=28760 RepID=A0AAV9RGD8_9TELE